MIDYYEDRIDYYIKVVACNKIKALIKRRINKIFPEYENEVDKYIELGKQKLKQLI